jgi:hypothetical protein
MNAPTHPAAHGAMSRLMQLHEAAHWNFSLKTRKEKFWLRRHFWLTRTRLHTKRQSLNRRTHRAGALWRVRAKLLHPARAPCAQRTFFFLPKKNQPSRCSHTAVGTGSSTSPWMHI